MNYQQALDYIHSLDRFGSRPGLDRVQLLFDRVPDAMDQRFIHIAGTNGKGSVSAMLSRILEEAGYRVGLFISPFIVDFRERIQINNEMIAKEELADAVSYFLPIMDELNTQGVIITEFEFLTVLGFWLFKQHQCDIVVCEVGMGGLLDSTNLIPSPLCTVITRIALDHTAILGDSIEEIALQKCGIIKTGCAVASSSQDDGAMRIIRDTCAATDSPLYLGSRITLHDVLPTAEGIHFTYLHTQMHLPLIGDYQIENLRCALAAIEAITDHHGLSVDVSHIADGLSKVRHPARFEKLADHPTVILDGAHNPNGLAAFAKAVDTYYPDRDRTLLIGMLADKDSEGLHLLKGLFCRAIATTVSNPRALSAEELSERLRDIVDEVYIIDNPQVALKSALAYGDDVFICGSLYLASEIRPYLTNK